MNETLEIFGMIFISHHQPAKVEQPGKESLDFPAARKTTKRPAILSFDAPVHFIGSNHFYAVIDHQLFIQPIAVVSFIADEPFGNVGDCALVESCFDQSHFSWRSTFCPQGERKTMAVCNAHNFGAFAPLGLADQGPPFLAGTNVPSTKHSLRSSPPASLRCCARVKSSCSKTPERTQFWKRRCAVWYEPYRSGMSFQGAPVRRIHKIPLSTVRLSVHGRPRPSSRTASGGRMVSTRLHCSFVNSIHNYLSINDKSTSTKLYYL